MIDTFVRTRQYISMNCCYKNARAIKNTVPFDMYQISIDSVLPYYLIIKPHIQLFTNNIQVLIHFFKVLF